MFKVFSNAWKVKEIRTKIYYVLFVVAIYRLGCVIPLPSINVSLLKGATGIADGSIFAMIAGGGYGTLFAMGIGPYITSSIIMQLLTVAIPKLEQLQKEGQEGRNKINQYTRVVALFLAGLQGSGTVYTLANQGIFVHNNWLVYIMGVISLVTGTIFVMWLSEVLTEKGFGNGSSFIIYSNILSSLPKAIMDGIAIMSGKDTYSQLKALENPDATVYRILGLPVLGVLKVIVIVILFLFVVAFAVLIQDGERRIPVQYSKKMVGRQMTGASSSYIPLKVNMAGVMSIIFAISLLQFPSVIAGFVKAPWLTSLVNTLQISSPVGAVLYIVLIFFFTFFYTSFSMNPIEMAENMKKNGGFIPGIRPGKPTSDYIDRSVNRLSWIGATFYSAIAIIPVLFEWIFHVKIGIGGTTLLIVSSVALEIVKQLESQLLMRHYKGFLD